MGHSVQPMRADEIPDAHGIARQIMGLRLVPLGESPEPGGQGEGEAPRTATATTSDERKGHCVTDRKPPARVESRDPHSIQFTPEEWTALQENAMIRGLEPAVFVRMLVIYALRIVQAGGLGEGSVGMPPEARGMWRF